jgi:4-hydroxy-2-oxoheptanedioate aldolase
MFRPNALKSRLARGEASFGVVHALANASVAEMIGLAGFDFVLIDGEHGTGDHQAHLSCLQAVAATSATALLRVEANDRTVLKRALDLGIEGVMVPDIRSAEEARQVVAACRYPPQGVRGYAASGVRGSDYGFQTPAYLSEFASRFLIAVMIESKAGVENAPAIAAVEGIDVIQIGANDLSYDLGVPEQLDHPLLRASIDAVEAAAIAHGKTLGGATLPDRDAPALIQRGYRLITVGRDVGLLAKALTMSLAGVSKASERGGLTRV